jgi:hypothetical protein
MALQGSSPVTFNGLDRHSKRRQATPVLVSANGEAVQSLFPLELTNNTQYDERWLQRLVHRQPSVLPIPSIEATFWPAISVCMELPLRSGYLDNFLVTPAGDLIAIECKLWRNADARRKVIAQAIDYAKDLQGTNYSDLERAIRTSRKEPAYELFRDVSNAEPDSSLDESRFIDAVSRNLRRARFLLVIVGDGITENLESMGEFLQQHAGLHFALALVQLALYELPNTKERLVIPSILMRTINVTRGIVEMADGLPKVIAPPNTPRHTTPTTLSAEELFGALDKIQPDTSDRLINFLKACEDLQITYEVKKTIIIRMIVEDYKTVPFAVSANGNVDAGYTFGLKDLMHSFALALATAIPGTVVRETPKSWTVKKRNGEFFTIWEVLEHQNGVRSALDELNKTLRKAAD